MELDFTKLNTIATKPRRTAQEALNEPLRSNSTVNAENPAEGLVGANNGISRLQGEANQRNAEIQRAQQINKEYQSNIQASSQLQAEILKGIKQGESVYNLFLKAARTISLMTTNSAFYSQAESDLIAIYGAGLLESEPLNMELEAIQGRLARLRAAYERDTEPQDSRQRIASAIKAHEARAATLENIIKQ